MLSFAGFVLSRVYKIFILDTLWKTGIGMAFGREVCMVQKSVSNVYFLSHSWVFYTCDFCMVLNIMFLIQMGLFFPLFVLWPCDLSWSLRCGCDWQHHLSKGQRVRKTSWPSHYFLIVKAVISLTLIAITWFLWKKKPTNKSNKTPQTLLSGVPLFNQNGKEVDNSGGEFSWMLLKLFCSIAIWHNLHYLYCYYFCVLVILIFTLKSHIHFRNAKPFYSSEICIV